MSTDEQPGSAKKKGRGKAAKKREPQKKSPLFRAVYIPEAVFLQYNLEKRRRGVAHNKRFMQILLHNLRGSKKKHVKTIKKSRQESASATTLKSKSSSQTPPSSTPSVIAPAEVSQRSEPNLVVSEAAQTRFLRLQQHGKYDNTDDLLLHMLSLEEQYQQEVRNLLEVAQVGTNDSAHVISPNTSTSQGSVNGLPSTSVVTSSAGSLINGPSILPNVTTAGTQIQPDSISVKAQSMSNLTIAGSSGKNTREVDSELTSTPKSLKPRVGFKELSPGNDPLQKEEMAAAAALASIYQTLTKTRHERRLEYKLPQESWASYLSGGNYPGDLMCSSKQSSSSLAKFISKNSGPLQISLHDINQLSSKLSKSSQDPVFNDSPDKADTCDTNEMGSLPQADAMDVTQPAARGRGRGRGRGRPRGRRSVIRPVEPAREELLTRHSPRLSPRSTPVPNVRGKGRSPGRGRGRKRTQSFPSMDSEMSKEFDIHIKEEESARQAAAALEEEAENQDPESVPLPYIAPETEVDIIIPFDNETEFDLTYNDNPEEDPDFDADGEKPLRKRRRYRERMSTSSDVSNTPVTPTTPVMPNTPFAITPISPRNSEEAIDNTITENLDSEQLDKALAEEGGSSSSMIVKLGDKGYMCKVCGKVVNKVSTMNLHIYKVHTQKAMSSFRYIDGNGMERSAEIDKLYVISEPISPDQEVSFDQTCYGEWICKICQKKVTTENGKQTHIQKHTNPTFTCVLCSAVYFGERYMKNHVIDHHALRPYPCDQCNYKALHEMDLEHHVSYVHQKAGKYPCPKCGKVFRRAPSLRLHQSKEHPDIVEGDLVCPYCGLEFEDKASFGDHLMQTHPIDVFPCPHSECGTKWPTQKLLIRHLQNVHPDNDMRNFLCDQCGKTFKNRDDVRIHQQRVHAERNFVCPDEGCGKTFKRKAHLEVHLRIHRDEKPLQCELCVFRCRQKNSLNWHLKKHHGIGGDLPPRKRSDSKSKDKGKNKDAKVQIQILQPMPTQQNYQVYHVVGPQDPPVPPPQPEEAIIHQIQHVSFPTQQPTVPAPPVQMEVTLPYVPKLEDMPPKIEDEVHVPTTTDLVNALTAAATSALTTVAASSEVDAPPMMQPEQQLQQDPQLQQDAPQQVVTTTTMQHSESELFRQVEQQAYAALAGMMQANRLQQQQIQLQQQQVQPQVQPQPAQPPRQTVEIIQDPNQWHEYVTYESYSADPQATPPVYTSQTSQQSPYPVTTVTTSDTVEQTVAFHRL